MQQHSIPVWCLLLLLFTLPVAGCAQQADSLASLRQFMAICNTYKKAPLYVNIDVNSSADIITSPEDTAQYNVSFFIQKNDAYIKMAGEEQLINDSLVLFISNKLRRMVLYANPAGQVAAQLNNFNGILGTDSSLQKIAAKYQAAVVPNNINDTGTGIIRVTSRAIVPGTLLPKEAIQVTYRQNTKQPVAIIQVQRKMIPLDSATYSTLIQKALYPGKLVNPAKGYWFLIKELCTQYVFKEMDYDANMQLPLQISKCIIKNQQGHYMPANGYTAFRLSEEN